MGKMWENQSRIEQVFIYQSVDAQNTKAIQFQTIIKSNAVFYPYPHCVIARYTPHKKNAY